MLSHTLSLLAASASLASLAGAQAPPPAVSQSTGFNSSFSLSSAQIQSAQLSDELATSIENIVNFDRSQYAHGGAREDDFYNLPPLVNSTHLKSGQLLKVQAVTEPTAFAIPPSTALSRILYTSQTLNGTVIPASAFILWPFSPRTFGDSTAAPVVLWGHASSGPFADWAPSAHRGLWHANTAPFTLAQAGYVVVAPDYAGLGVDATWDGTAILHPYLHSPTGAGDALDALRASRDAFPEKLTDEYVVAGHSQGGGVAWAVAEALASEDRFADLVDGFKGAVAGSPTTNLFTTAPAFIAPWVGQMLHTIFPDFDISTWLTPLGIARLDLFKALQGGISMTQQLFLSEGKFVKPDYTAQSYHADAYANISNVGRKPFQGPLLVIQGTDDFIVPYDVTKDTVEATWDFLEESGDDADLEFLVAHGMGHVPSLEATRRQWLQWIEDRFEGRPVPVRGAVRTDLESYLPVGSYQTVGTSFPQWAGAPEYTYEVPLGL